MIYMAYVILYINIYKYGLYLPYSRCAYIHKHTHIYIYILRSTTLPLFLPKPYRALYIFCHWFNWNVLPITTASKLNKKLT